MLKSLVLGELDSKVILIQDTSNTKSDVIFSAFLQNYSKNVTSHHLICTERHIDDIVNSEAISRLEVTDLYSDPLGWNNESYKKVQTLNLINCFSEKTLDDTVIYIESLNPFLWHNGMIKFTKEFLKLSQLSTSIVGCIHKDTTLDSGDELRIKYLATTFIDIVERLEDGAFLVEVHHKKADGRVDRVQKELVSVDFQFNVSSSVFTEHVRRPVKKTVNMESLTTFNLGTEMKPSEKEAREQLVLPYISMGSGLVEYEADDADLEEDPDEDLEF